MGVGTRRVGGLGVRLDGCLHGWAGNGIGNGHRASVLEGHDTGYV